VLPDRASADDSSFYTDLAVAGTSVSAISAIVGSTALAHQLAGDFVDEPVAAAVELDEPEVVDALAELWVDGVLSEDEAMLLAELATTIEEVLEWLPFVVL